MPFARSPSPEVAFACGSRSTTSARSPASARQAARLTAVVVLPTPPFWFATRVDPCRAHAPDADSGQRTFPGHPRAGAGSPPAWAPTCGRRASPARSSGAPPPSCSATRATALEVGATGPTPEHGRAARRDERQAPLGRDRRRRERLRDRDAVDVGRPAPRRARRRRATFGKSRRHALEELGLAPARLEQRHLAVRQRGRERNPGRAAAGADVDDRPLEAAHDARAPRSASSSSIAPRLGAVRDRGQAGRRERRASSQRSSRGSPSAARAMTTT